MVLGLEWLASLGEFKVDFGQLRLTIGKGEIEHCIIVDPTLSKFETSLKTILQVGLGKINQIALHYQKLQ